VLATSMWEGISHVLPMLRILLADDNETVRHLVNGVLSSVPDWTVCGEATDGQRAVVLAKKLKPDVVLLDYSMPLMNGVHAASEIKKFLPAATIVLYTLHQNPYLEADAKKAGVTAVISKGDSISLVEAMKKILTSEL
jgi:DNA-binding NarL/FixJ family response regulator